MMDLALVLIIVAAAAFGLYRALRRPGAADTCSDCPLKDKCADKNQKKSSNTCTTQK